jgi:hypothetical protein
MNADPTPTPLARAPADGRPTSCVGVAMALGSIALGGLYLLNPTFGFLEIVPDNIPFWGNLDEAGATGMVIFGFQYLGRRRREKRLARESARLARESARFVADAERGRR